MNFNRISVSICALFGLHKYTMQKRRNIFLQIICEINRVRHTYKGTMYVRISLVLLNMHDYTTLYGTYARTTVRIPFFPCVTTGE